MTGQQLLFLVVQFRISNQGAHCLLYGGSILSGALAMASFIGITSHHPRYRQNPEPNTPPPKHDISDLLQVTLNNMYFSFRDQVFRQREGLHMGSSISGILAILFMDKLDTIALSTHLMISPYMRYVDDIYLQSLDFKFCFLNSSLRPPQNSFID